ncbi:hypothetical protein K1719_027444 [Acacia pycnantha]|nr:hypothetical protein K1719_027444 [Acacia pycnantha]
MEKHMSGNGNKHPKAVQLKLGSQANVQKGRALVGRLETDKNLNKGVVISMIKKGWSLDKGMEIHEMPYKNTFLFRFTKQEDYVRVLKGRPWSILARNCKFLLESADAEETVVRYGNGMGIPHVKTIEEALVVHDQNWDESILLWDKPPRAAVEQTSNPRTIGVFSNNGNKQVLGDISAISPPRPPILINTPANSDDTVMQWPKNPSSLPLVAQVAKNRRITELDVEVGADLQGLEAANGKYINPVNSTECNFSESTILNPPHLMDPTNRPLQPLFHAETPYTSAEAFSNPNQLPNLQPVIPVSVASPEPLPLIQTTCFHVESPPVVPAIMANTISHVGLSPLSAVILDLNRIHLKRQQDHLDMEMNPTPTKRRLLFLEPALEVSNTTSNTPDTLRNTHVNFQKLKNSIRGKKATNKYRSSNGNNYVSSLPPHVVPMQNLIDDELNNTTPDFDNLSTADGCHQAAIGSP